MFFEEITYLENLSLVNRRDCMFKLNTGLRVGHAH
jgi:hypothetical protein